MGVLNADRGAKGAPACSWYVSTEASSAFGCGEWSYGDLRSTYAEAAEEARDRARTFLNPLEGENYLAWWVRIWCVEGSGEAERTERMVFEASDTNCDIPEELPAQGSWGAAQVYRG